MYIRFVCFFLIRLTAAMTSPNLPCRPIRTHTPFCLFPVEGEDDHSSLLVPANVYELAILSYRPKNPKCHVLLSYIYIYYRAYSTHQLV